ncbi:hypothetical protein [Bdellovibrio sp. HCB337]|uniref:hypothetical protein n=1 Tax=Bdellovibrio sp. HCB337 TaxID=3394358 RepID=UPI0039A694BA
MHVGRKVQSFNTQLENQFATASTKLIELLSKEGVKNQAYLEGLPYFSQLNEEQKRTAVERLEGYYELCSEQLSEGQPLRDSKRFTWRALSKFGLVPTSNLLETIGDGDIVEIYNSEQVQVFRNLEFFDLCSYTLEELFCLEWYRLFRRESEVSSAIVAMVDELYAKKYPEGLSSPLPHHIVAESISREKITLNFFMKFIAPLYKNKQVAGLVCIEQAAII